MNQVSVDWSPWITEDDSLIRQYDFSGPSFPNSKMSLQIHLTLAKPTLLAEALPEMRHTTQKHVGIYLSPDLGCSECYLLAQLALEAATPSDGRFFPVKASPVSGDATLVWVEDREATDEVFNVLAKGQDMKFLLMSQQEAIVSLPLPNDPSFLQQYEELEATINPR